MKSFATTPPKDFALLIVGPPGSGKSTLAGRFPKPHFINTDHNLRGPCAQLMSEGITDITYDDEIDRDASGKPFPLVQQWPRVNKALVTALESDRETIILDNTTQLSDIILAECLRQSPTKTHKPEIPTWGQFFIFWKEFVLKTRAENRGKRIIFISHEKYEKDEETGSMKYFIAIPGQTGTLMSSFVTDVWRTEVKEEWVNGQRIFKRLVRVVQDTRHEYVKTSIPTLPSMFEATQAEINKILPLL